MLWLTWRQHRMQVLVTAVLLVGVGVLLELDSVPIDLVKMLPWAPVLVGLFWGVPLLVKEHERGTERLVWTQSVTRLRWLAVKLAGLSLAVLVAGLVLGLLMSRWTATARLGMDRFSGDMFGVTGVAPAAWFLVVFALGAASGAVLRRMLPAMAVTIAVFAGLVIGAYLARGHYATPSLALSGPDGMAVPAGALIASQGVRNAAGDEVSWDDARPLCAGQDAVGCMRDRGYVQQYTRYHAASQYWRFQWTEAGLLVLIAVGLTGVTAFRVLRRPL